MLKAIDGNGTKLVGWAAIAIGAAEAMGWIPAGTSEQAAVSLDNLENLDTSQIGSPGLLILFGAGIIRLRMGMQKAENKAAEAVEAAKNGK